MEAVGEPGSKSAPEAGGGGELGKWVDYAVHQSLALTQTLAGAADSAISSAGSAGSRFLSASSGHLHRAQEMVETGKAHYAATEEMVFEKIKEGMLVAASHPGLSAGIASGVGLIIFKRPRRLLIQNTRRLFVKEEVFTVHLPQDMATRYILSSQSLLSDAEAKVNELRQSINLVRNESLKLEERASKAEQEYYRGLEMLMLLSSLARGSALKERHNLKDQLRDANRIEKDLHDLKEFLGELPGRGASQYRPQVSKFISQVKQEKKTLNRELSKMLNHGIPI